MLSVDVKVFGAKRTQKRLRKMKGVLTDYRGALSEIGRYLKDFYSVNVFETEGGAFNQRWEDLDEEYALRKSEEYPGRGILEASGKLRRGYKKKVTKKYMLLYNKTPYGKYHQSTKPRRVLSRRPLIVFDKPRQDGTRAIFKRHLYKNLRKALR